MSVNDESKLYDFDEQQLDILLNVLYGNPTYDTLGLTKSNYYACKTIDLHYHTKWDKHIDNACIKWLGFIDMEHLKTIFIRANLYNAMRIFPHMTLKEYISWNIRKIDMNEKDKNKNIEIKNGNLIELFMQFEVDDILKLGV
jgi:hypothetical protein